MSDYPLLADARALFALPADTSYLNAAYMGPMPEASIRAGEQAYRRRAAPWQFDLETEFFAVPEQVRAQGAKLFQSSADDIALVTSASYGLAVAARNIGLKPGQEILVLAAQFPSNVYVWQALARQTGARLVTVARGAEESWTDAVSRHIRPATGLLACPAVHWIDGGMIDLAALRPALDAAGAALVLDLTQSLGVLPFDVAACRPDFAVSAGYKWLLGPYQSGLLYVAPHQQGGAPLEENWINRQGASDFARLVDYQDAYETGARRFDAGERSAFQTLPAFLASLELLNHYGADAIEAQLAELTRQLAELAAPFGLKPATKARAPHYLALALPATAPGDLLSRFQSRGVHLSRRGDSLRISPHIYNNGHDLARFAGALKAVF